MTTPVFASDHEVTDLTEMNIDQVDAVMGPANGADWLIVKALPDEVTKGESEITELVDITAPRVDGVRGPANGIPFLMIKQQEQLDELNAATARVLAREQLREDTMPADPNGVAKAAVDQAAFVKSLDGLSPTERAERIRAYHGSKVDEAGNRIWKGTESLDGRTPIERAHILKARRR